MTNRERLNDIRNSLGWSQRRLAEELSALTGDKISKWTVKSWLSDPSSIRSRPCPGWPIAVLSAKHPASRS